MGLETLHLRCARQFSTLPEGGEGESPFRPLSKTYFAAVKEVFGDHGQVIDRFHVVQQAGGALDEVLRAVQKQLAPEDAKALKKLRKRWLKSAAQRTVDALIARDEWRQRFPQWRETIDWVQDLRRWFNRK